MNCGVVYIATGSIYVLFGVESNVIRADSRTNAVEQIRDFYGEKEKSIVRRLYKEDFERL